MASFVDNPLEQVLIDEVAKNGKIDDTWDFSIAQDVNHQTLIGAVKALLVDGYLLDEPLSLVYW